MSVQVKGSGTIGGIDEGLNITGIVTATSLELSSTNPTLTFTDTNHNSDFHIENADGSFEIRDVTNGADRIRIASDGTINLLSNINVSGEVTISTFLVHAGDTNTKFGFEGPDTITFDTAGAERLRIDDNGHIHIKGTDHELRFYRDAGDRYGAITYDGGQFNIKNPVNDNTNVTKSDGTLHTRFSNSGDLQIANGNLVISNAGSGIDFSAAGNAGGMTSEVLDDYEEGSWTPSVTIETRPASDSPIDSVQGNYIKVGGLVHAFGQFTLNGTPSERSTSRAIELRGFPFTHNYNYDKAGGDIRSSGHLINSTYGSDIYFVMRMINGAAYCRIEIIEQGYAGTRNASPVMTDNMNVIFSFTYSAA